METDHGAASDQTNHNQMIGRVDLQAGSHDPLAGASPVLRLLLLLMALLIMGGAIFLILHHVFTA